jgi:hypothetical protein
MNLLRESHSQKEAKGFPVILEVSHLKKITIDLLYGFIESWLLKNCKSPWELNHVQEISDHVDHKTHTYIRIVFSDVREALYFKMGPHGMYNRSSLPLSSTAWYDLAPIQLSHWMRY